MRDTNKMAISAVNAVTVVATHRINRSRPAANAGTLGNNAGTAGRRSTGMTQLLCEAQNAEKIPATPTQLGTNRFNGKKDTVVNRHTDKLFARGTQILAETIQILARVLRS